MLEPIAQAHAAPLLELLRDERLFQYQPHWLPSEFAELRERFSIYATGRSRDGTHKQFNWAAKRRDDAAYVGMVQVTFGGDVPQLGYMVFPPFWRRGYGSEAVAAVLDWLRDECAMPSIWTSVDARNDASIALLERLGFSRVATIPSDAATGHADYRYARSL